MQLTKNQKEVAVLAVLVVATIAVIGTFMMKKTGGADPFVDAEVPSDVVVQGVDPIAGNVSGNYSFLPEGFDVDLDVLTDIRFKSLTPPSYPVVEQSEIGNPDPFQTQ
jgi:hypothetical protein